MPRKVFPRGDSSQKISQFDPGVWAVGGVLAILSTAHLLFRALLYMVAELRKRSGKELEMVVHLEDRIARATVEIEYCKHYVATKRWPKRLYLPSPTILRMGETRSPLSRPVSSYQVVRGNGK